MVAKSSYCDPKKINALSATELARLVKDGVLTAEQLVRAALDRATT